jgi:hypothetical protein
MQPHPASTSASIPNARPTTKALLASRPTIGSTVVYRGQPYVVESATRHWITEDEPSAWGHHLLGHEDTWGWLTVLAPV